MVITSQVELKSATKIYGELAAIDNVDLQIMEGEFFSILGPSGSGKTTILRAIAGLLELSSGEILIGGRSVCGVPVYRRDLSIVFQNYALFPHMNVFNNVSFGLRMHNIRGAELHQRVNEALRLVRLEGMETRRPNQLSGGQQQRVALSRAIVTRPKVLLLDEPLGALDKNLRESMQIELKTLQRELGITTLFITHDQEEALTLSDRIAIINRGHIEQVGTPTEVYEKPANKFVASFVGQTNLAEAVVRECSGGKILAETPEGLQIVAESCGIRSKPGDQIFVAIRPEKIQLSRFPQPEGSTSMQGVIKHIVYKGAHTILHVLVKNQPLVVIEKNVTSGAVLSCGESIFVRWLPENVRILKG